MSDLDEYPPGWCFHHEQEHGPMDWRDGCQSVDDLRFSRQHEVFQLAWEQVGSAEGDLRRRRRKTTLLKRITVCWWKHRTRRVGAGTYVSGTCWACAGPRP